MKSINPDKTMHHYMCSYKAHSRNVTASSRNDAAAQVWREFGAPDAFCVDVREATRAVEDRIYRVRVSDIVTGRLVDLSEETDDLELIREFCVRWVHSESVDTGIHYRVPTWEPWDRWKRLEVKDIA
jgi:hypothetical protein